MNITFVRKHMPKMASYRYRAKRIADFINASNSGLPNARVSHNTIPSDPYDIIVISKHDKSGLTPFLCGHKGPVLVDICDYHFDTKYAQFYIDAIARSDLVIVNSEAMKQILCSEKRCPENKIVIIEDAYESTLKDFHFSNPPSLFMYGYFHNLIKAVDLPIHKYKLNIVTNVQMGEREGNTTVYPYSSEIMETCFKESNIAIIGLKNSIPQVCVSAIRGIEALVNGLLPIITQVSPSYEPIKNYCYCGNIEDGIDFYIKFPETTRAIVEEGQKFVKEKYHINNIGAKWIEVFKKFI